jgi:hypothetical protein
VDFISLSSAPERWSSIDDADGAVLTVKIFFATR